MNKKKNGRRGLGIEKLGRSAAGIDETGNAVQKGTARKSAVRFWTEKGSAKDQGQKI